MGTTGLVVAAVGTSASVELVADGPEQETVGLVGEPVVGSEAEVVG